LFKCSILGELKIFARQCACVLWCMISCVCVIMCDFMWVHEHDFMCVCVCFVACY
jgi:hypothetical protein